MDDFRHCPNCGHEHASGEAFCSKCGANLRDYAVPGPGRQGSSDPVGGVPFNVSPSGVLQAAVFPYGGFWIRFVAGIIDGLIWSVLSAVLSVALGPGEAGTGLIVFVLYYIYVPGCTTYWGATPGKLLLGYHVVGNDGRHVSFLRALGRELAKFISTVVLLVGFFWVGVDARKQGWHDKIAGTFVVRKEFVKL